MLRRGDTVGVFQLEGGPMRALLRSLAPTSFEDIAALRRAVPPGPDGAELAQRVRRPEERPQAGRPTRTPDLEEVLAPTYGLMIYQEQLMRVAQRLAGYSLEEADNLRKATGKKIRALIAKERSQVRRRLRRAGPLGASSASGSSTPSSRSPTTRSTSRTRSAYGYVAYQTAWLKANYPVEYLAALLTSVKTNKDQTAVFLNECRQLGIDVLVPDVNESESDFSGARPTATVRRRCDPVRHVGGAQRGRGRGRRRSSPRAKRAARSPTSTTSATASTRRC